MKAEDSTPLPATERWLYIVAILLVISQFVLVIRYFTVLPEMIPVHFGDSGKPDRWGNRWQIFIMPTFSALLVLLFWGLRQIPAEFYNLVTSLTAENQERQVRNTHEMLAMFLVVITILLSWLEWYTVQAVRNGGGVRPTAPVVFFFLAVGATVIFYGLRAHRLK